MMALGECPDCRQPMSTEAATCPHCGRPDIYESRLETFHALHPNNPTVTPFFDYRLADLGIPPLHLLTVADNDGHRLAVELSGDRSSFKIGS